MTVQSFEVVDIKCVDDVDGDQGVRFIGKNKMVTLVPDRDHKGHDKRDLRVTANALEFRSSPLHDVHSRPIGEQEQ
jgi:hypothetical protein